MDNGTTSLYVVAPDANAALMKRLRGIGVSTGISVIPVSDVKELPIRPSSPAVLLVPDSALIGSIEMRNWFSIFLISSSKNMTQHHDALNTVHVKTKDHLQIDWTNLTTIVVRKFIKNITTPSWHAIQESFPKRAETASFAFSLWASSHKALPAGKLTQIGKLINSVEKTATSKAPDDFSLQVTLDPEYLCFNLSFPETSHKAIKKIAALFQSLDSCQIVTFSKEKSALSIEASFWLGKPKNDSVAFYINQTLWHAESEKQRKEAS